MENNLLLFNGNLVRFEGRKNYHWIAVRDGMIVDAGFETGYEQYRGSFKDELDLKGKTVLPGFYDCHVHFVQTALKRISIDLGGVKNYSEIQQRITEWREEHPRDVIVRAFTLEAAELEEKRFPTRKVLDQYAKDYALWINSRDFHISVLNTKAMHQLKVPLTMDGVETDSTGNPTGILSGQVNALIRKKISMLYTRQEKSSTVMELARDILKRGVTSVNAMEGGYLFSEDDAALMLLYKDILPVDVTLFYGTTDVSKALMMGLDRVGGDIFADGAFASFNAAIVDHYERKNGNGILFFSQGEMDEFMQEAYRNGLSTSVHCVGGRAVEQALIAHERAKAAFPQGAKRRHRIEHAELTTHGQKERAKALGLIFSMQPAFEYFYGGPGFMYENRLGDRYKQTNQYRQLMDMGIVVCGGSDSDLTPIDPILGIHAAVNHPVAENRVTVEEAVRMFTWNAAYSVNEEDRKGSIEVGKVADLAVLDKDIFRINKKEIITTDVLATVKNGSLLYTAL